MRIQYVLIAILLGMAGMFLNPSEATAGHHKHRHSKWNFGLSFGCSSPAVCYVPVQTCAVQPIYYAPAYAPPAPCYGRVVPGSAYYGPTPAMAPCMVQAAPYPCTYCQPCHLQSFGFGWSR
ncbi:MAG: hypothetical protein Q8K75_04190 [Chlamydiales bacterium]|nr:hypothetical protein [Chlamydiales bacterium]